MVKKSLKNISLSNFRDESFDLLSTVTNKINSSSIKTFNFDMHNNYKVDKIDVEMRLNGIIRKFRKCEMNYYLYFDDVHHDILTFDQRDLPISRQCIFSDGTGKITQLFDIDDKSLYQERN